jgi:hypothetical protein
VLAIIVAVPLAANSVASIAIARWSVTIQQVTRDWLAAEPGGRVYDVDWSGVSASLDVTTDDGSVPPIEDLQKALSTAIPSFVGVTIDVGQGVEHVVQ